MNGSLFRLSIACVAGLCALFAQVAYGEGTALPHPPSAVEIQLFQTDKVLYPVGEPVTFRCRLRVSNASPSLIPAVEAPIVTPPLVLEVWDETDLQAPAKVATTEIAEARNGAVEAQLKWEPGSRLYGHQATLRVFDEAGRELARARTLYEVTDERWEYLMRYASMAGYLAVNEAMTKQDLERIVEALRAAQVNTLELYAWMPEAHDLTPEGGRWKSAYYRQDRHPYLSDEKLVLLGELLHDNGMKLVAYNEVEVLDPKLLPPGEDPEAYKVYLRDGDKLTLVAMYQTSEACFMPNSLKVAGMFARELRESVRRFDWDGILMDSGTAAFVNTATGFDAQGQRLTDLTPGQVGERYVGTARKAVLPVKPGFRFLCQNLGSSITGARRRYFLPREEQYAAIERVLREDFGGLPEVVDAWSVELDPHFDPQKNYPQLLEQYALSANIVRDVTNKPILQWLQAAAAYRGDYTEAYTGALLSTVSAARLTYNDHFSNYGGLLGPWGNAPTNARQLQINRFVTRYSRFLRAPALRWMRDPAAEFSVEAQRELLWKPMVYTQQTPQGQQWIMNLINTDNPNVRPQNVGGAPHEVPPVAFPVSVNWQPPAGTQNEGLVAYALDAEDVELRAVPLKVVRQGAQLTVSLPPIRSWMAVVFQQPTPGQ